jgi:SAM-dependent methyltransferase
MRLLDLNNSPITLNYIIQCAMNHNKILEISPFYRPCMIGENVSYFDVLDKEGLIENAKRMKLPTDAISDMHYVSRNGDLSIISGKFDIVFSSHVIEHTIDLITHLNQVYSLLNENGKYILAIPDYRYCFDHFRGQSKFPEIDSRCLYRKKKESLSKNNP